jgi:hypothetical protein
MQYHYLFVYVIRSCEKKLLHSVYQPSVLYTAQKREMDSVFTFCFPAQPITVHAEILCNREESQNI